MSPATQTAAAADVTVLDGNAAGGLLRQLFAFDVTVARVVCTSCEKSHAVGALKLYGLPMGSVLRCPDCSAVLIRVVAHEPEYWLDLRGVASLRVVLPAV